MFWVMFISVTMVGLGHIIHNIHMLSKKLSYDKGFYLIIIFQKAPIFLLLSNLAQHWADSRTGYNLPGYTVTAFAHTHLEQNMIYHIHIHNISYSYTQYIIFIYTIYIHTYVMMLYLKIKLGYFDFMSDHFFKL